MGYDSKYLTLRKVRIVRLLGKFEDRDSRIVITMWMKGVNSFDEYVSKS